MTSAAFGPQRAQLIVHVMTQAQPPDDQASNESDQQQEDHADGNHARSVNDVVCCLTHVVLSASASFLSDLRFSDRLVLAGAFGQACAGHAFAQTALL